MNLNPFRYPFPLAIAITVVRPRFLQARGHRRWLAEPNWWMWRGRRHRKAQTAKRAPYPPYPPIV